MTRHLTIRMAWHDDNWNGKVCQEPEKNHYCVGTHSLLSDRLARKRNLEIEKKNAGKKLDALGDYLPPCYWTSNAFSNHTLNVWHDHPFTTYEKDHKIKEKLSGYSVFTWPFRLSFNHSKERSIRYGQYPPDLEERVEQFIDKFQSGETILFFYLNFDNPISADENKYVLVGCATLKQLNMGKHFEFDPAVLKKIRSRSKKMAHFPTLNWAINASYDFSNNGVLLPYKEYLEHVEENPENSDMLDEMKILIEEEDMIPNFKYVTADIDDDSCIYLLTKLRKSFSKIKEHAIVDKDWTKNQIVIIDKLLERAWKLRGVYPGLGNILDVVGEIPEEDFGNGEKIVKLVKENTTKNILEGVFSLITKGSDIPDYLEEYEGMISDIQINLSGESKKLLQKLSLFSFTQNQIKNIITKNPKNFKTEIDLNKVESNPYLLCENYSPGTPDLDEITVSDREIGTFTIDVGMFPNSKFLKRDIKLQDLKQNSPQRLRAVIINYLKILENKGDCYAPLHNIYEFIKDFPLFYREELDLPEDDLVLNKKYQTHFAEKLVTIENKHDHYFYLKEIYQAEKLIKNSISTLLERKDNSVKVADLDQFLDSQASILGLKIKNFPKEQFHEERKKLIQGALTKSLFVISGKPGSGKTQAIKKVIDAIKAKGENVTLIAPTGKASLRLKMATEDQGAKTIDRLIYSEGYADILNDFENFIIPKSRKEPIIQNLVIDESSMLDLKKLAVLFKMITNEKGDIWTKRVILVGDENQLPPIGYGKPFFDIIEYIKTNEKYRKANFVELRTNCRQQFDNEIIRVAEIFRSGNRYYEETLNEIVSGKFSSPGFSVHLWDDQEELFKKIEKRLNEITIESLKNQGIKLPSEKSDQLNLLFGLTNNGSVKGGSQSMTLDSFQILSPYRGNYFGTLGLNDKIKSTYRHQHPLESKMYGKQIPFTHSDKIISIANQYDWDPTSRRIDLVLSNGSIGIVNIINDPYPQRRFFFSDLQYPLEKLKEPDDYELAYAITIHKSQGSEFEHTFIVIPSKRSLLSRELLYTALTRSTRKVTLFLQNDKENSVLENARSRSDILPRLTSIFSSPEDSRKIYEPKPGVFVRSKVEYILFKELENKGVDFEYEKPHEFKTKNKKIVCKPDFTIKIGKEEFYLEHLGMLDTQEYYENWKQRKELYEENNLGDKLITTDDLNGIKEEKIVKLVDDLMNKMLKKTKESKFSLHHYNLY